MPDVADLYSALMQRGWSPVQAAALVGNMQQESNLNPQAFNAPEGAHGLLQWRLDRWNGLQNFAAARGTSPFDRDTQLDFINYEMNGPEARNAAAFRNAADLPAANAALKGYIRYGDNSQGTRLQYASAAAGLPAPPVQPTPFQPAPTAPTAPTNVALAFTNGAFAPPPLTFDTSAEQNPPPMPIGGQDDYVDPAFQPRFSRRKKPGSGSHQLA